MLKTFATLFSGIGGADLGLTNASFIPQYAVEWNQGAINILKANHKIPIIIHGDVCKVYYSKLPPVDILWASPVCCNFSDAKHHGIETQSDLDSAQAIIRSGKNARSVIIENVPKYLKSDSYNAIKAQLKSNGFGFYQEIIYNAHLAGNPSSRNRLYAVFSRKPQRQFYPELYKTLCPVKWSKTLLNYQNRWVPSSITENQQKAINWHSETLLETMFAVERCGYYKLPKIHNALSVFPCLKSHGGHDGKNPKDGYGKIGSYRRQYDFYHQGQFYSLTPELMGVLNGFPLDYNWGNNRAQAVAGIGNAVVPIMAEIISKLLRF
jgi:site-specific DNA-cytosine methylase